MTAIFPLRTTTFGTFSVGPSIFLRLPERLQSKFSKPRKEMFTLKKQPSKNATPTAALIKGGYLLGYFVALRLGFVVYSTFLEKLTN